MNIKKWIRVLLAVMLVALMVTMVACGPKKPPETPQTEDPEEEVALTDELVTIIRSLSPLVTTINGVKRDSTLSVDAAIGVDYTFGAGGEYAIGLKGNVSKDNPQVELTVQDRKNTSDPNWILLALLNNKLYLKQPLTTVNTESALNTTKVDLDAFSNELELVADVLMFNLAKVNLALDFDEIAEALDELLTQVPLDLSELITVTKNSSTGKTTLTINSEAAKTIVGLVHSLLISGSDFEGLVDSAINALIEEANGKGFSYINSDSFVFPTIALEVGTTGDALSGVSVGVDYKGVENAGANANKYAKLVIDLKNLSISKTTQITAPSYKINSLNLDLGVFAPQKDVSAELDFYVTGDMSKETNILGNGELTITNGSTAKIAKGYYNGKSAFFDIGGAFEAVEKTATESVYKAAADMYKAVKDGIEKWHADATADKPEPSEPEEDLGDGKSLMQSIYSWLGGTANLGKEDPTPKQMLEAVDGLIGDYIRFDIKKNSYQDAVSAITDAWNDNKEDVKKIIAEDKAWGELQKGDTWVGSLFLTKAGDKNDLLDAVNLFLCNGKDEDGKPIDIDVDFLTNIANKYLALIARSNSDLLGEDAKLYKGAVEILDNKLLYAKNVYLAAINKAGATEAQIKEAEDAYKEAKDAHYEALKFADGLNGDHPTLTAEYFAAMVLEQFFGYQGGTLKDFIEGGITVKVTCKKGEGLNGGIAIFGDTNNEEKEYVRISGSMEIVEQETTKGTDFDVEEALELTDSQETEDEVIDKWSDGTKKIDLDGSLENGTVIIYETIEGEFKKQYPNLEILQGDLWDLLEYYKEIPAA